MRRSSAWIAVLVAAVFVGAVGCAGPGVRFKKSDVSPQVFVGEVTISPRGALDKQIVHGYIVNWMPQIMHCHALAMGRRPGLAGTVRVRWVIVPTGQTTDVSVVESTVGDQIMEECMVGKISTWVFPSVKGGAPVIVTYPFTFTGDEPVPRPGLQAQARLDPWTGSVLTWNESAVGCPRNDGLSGTAVASLQHIHFEVAGRNEYTTRCIGEMVACPGGGPGMAIGARRRQLPSVHLHLYGCIRGHAAHKPGFQLVD